MTDDRRALAALLLVTQCALALLAAVGLSAYVKLSNAVAQLALPALVAFAGPLLLLCFAVGVLKGSRICRIGVYVFEALTMLGTLFSLLASGGSALLLTSGLTGLALPGAIIFLLRTGKRIDLRDGVTSALLLTTAVIHLSLVPEHLQEDPTLGRLFLLDGAAFLGLAYLRWRLPTALLLVATILAYLSVVLRGQEAVDDLGVATKFIELTALGLIVWPRQASRLSWGWLTAAAGLSSALVLSGGLTWAATLRGGEAGHSHAHTQAGKSLIAASAPTQQQQSAAAKLVDDTRSGTARFDDIHAALADGYVPTTPLKAPTVHYVNPKYAHSGVVDPQHPQALVYANTPNGPLLLGAMYMMPKTNQLPPDIGGSIAEWHTHNNLCFLVPGFVIDGLQSPFGTCPTGSINGPTPAMLHVWTVANPAGPFADLTPAFVARVTGRNA